MAKKIIKKIGGDRIGSGGKMTVAAHGYGFSTHDVSKVRRTSISFGTIVPMGMWLMPSGSRLRLRLDALATTNALLYQLYGSAKLQLDVYSVRMALYNPKMLLNLNDQGYSIEDIKFPMMSLTTEGLKGAANISNQQINPSALLRYLGIAANGQNQGGWENDVTREHNAMWLLFYYQTVKEYYANKQEKVGYMIHSEQPTVVTKAEIEAPNMGLPKAPQVAPVNTTAANTAIYIYYIGGQLEPEWININVSGDEIINFAEMFTTFQYVTSGGETYIIGSAIKEEFLGKRIRNWSYSEEGAKPRLVQYDLKAIDRMMMQIMANVENVDPITITSETELPYGASFRGINGARSINSSQEGICLGTYQSDVFNNWLDNTTINNLNNKSKVKVNEEGEFSINMLNITQKMYNYDMRIGITDGTLDEWREMTYGQKTSSKSLKPVYEGGLSKEIVFDMVVSTAGTADEPLASIASRGTLGNKHKGGYAQIEADEEKLVMVLAKITPRLVYNQGNDWTTSLKTLADLHKPAFDKIGYQNLITDTMFAIETVIGDNQTLITKSAGKQPAWQWYRTNYDDALGNMADTESYKVFGREYEGILEGDFYKLKDLTTYIDPSKFNDVFAIKSLDAMNIDLQVGMDATMTLVMSEEVIPGL